MSSRPLGSLYKSEVLNSRRRWCGCRTYVCHHFGVSFQTTNQYDERKEDFFDLACQVLFTEKPEILLLDKQRRLVAQTKMDDIVLEQNGILCWGRERRIGFRDAVSQKYLIQFMTNSARGLLRGASQLKSRFIPTSKGWPVVVLEGDDQKTAAERLNCDLWGPDTVTLLMRGESGFNEIQSRKMRQEIGI
ncbi:hypothetical protein [Sneathiella limimaris]|uniref:hypothetical protein n=1 Tax=Sneathiella limimaris TaxID=1964213 RepID=UPI00146BEC14|nr:hypothetical protein [Sneathiella limimaris]